MNAERINGAIRYLLQLSIEHHTDGASYAYGAEVLETVVATLEKSRNDRASWKRIALVAELVGSIEERLLLLEGGATTARVAYGTISKWLRRKGIYKTERQVAAILKQPVRPGAQNHARANKEKLLDRVASLLGISQSQFEKVVRTAELNRRTNGRLGAPLMHERAAVDAEPPQLELVLTALDAIHVDGDIREAIYDLFPSWHAELVSDATGQRRYGAALLAAERRAKRSVARVSGAGPVPPAANKIPAAVAPKNPPSPTRTNARRSQKGVKSHATKNAKG